MSALRSHPCIVWRNTADRHTELEAPSPAGRTEGLPSGPGRASSEKAHGLSQASWAWGGPWDSLDRPHFTVLCCIVLCGYVTEWKVCGNPVRNKSPSAVFPIAFAQFVFLCHILIILKIFQALSLLYLLSWSVISDLPCYYYNSLKAQMMLAFFSIKVFYFKVF